jgi:hypothetical protein
VKNPSVKAPPAEHQAPSRKQRRDPLPVTIGHKRHDEVQTKANILKFMVNAETAKI